MNIDIGRLKPGMFGVSHGGGLAGELIRHATESWAGHAFIYVGSGMLVEAAPPHARLVPATTHYDAVWAYRMPLTDQQSAAAVARARALIGTPYDYQAYVGFALEVLKLRNGTELDPIFKLDHWRVCSALVDDCYQFAKVTLDWSRLSLKPGQDPNLVSPAMLYDLAAAEGWT